jgi:hypothetical protein
MAIIAPIVQMNNTKLSPFAAELVSMTRTNRAPNQSPACSLGISIAFLMISAAAVASAYGQTITFEDYVTYEKQSSFIKEFPILVAEPGLEGLAIDANGPCGCFIPLTRLAQYST